MAALLIYLIKSTICITLFYLVFRWTLKKENLFSLNRILLIAILVLSVAIPLVKTPTLFHQTIKVKAFPDENRFAVPKLDDVAMQITTSPETSSPISTERNISVEQLSIIVYSTGFLILFSALLVGLVKLFLLLFQTKIYKRKNYRLALVNRPVSPMSFGKFIIMSKQDYKEHRNEILKHEQAHIKFKHTYDLLMVELIKLVHWFNPFVYQLRNDLKEIQEFQIDQHLLRSGINSKEYQLLLIKKCVGTERYALANSFNHCQIKNRIVMMNNSKNSKGKSWKVAIFLPVAALMLMAFGNNRGEIPLNSSIPEITGIAQEKKVWTESDFEKLNEAEAKKQREKDFFENKTWHSVLINRNSKIMMDEKKIDINDVVINMKELFTKALPSIKANLSVETKSVLPFTVFIRKDIATDANQYSQLLNCVANSFLDARKEVAKLKFSKAYSELSDEGRKVINTMIPMNIKIAVPKQMMGSVVNIVIRNNEILLDGEQVLVENIEKELRKINDGDKIAVNIYTSDGVSEELVHSVSKRCSDAGVTKYSYHLENELNNTQSHLIDIKKEGLLVNSKPASSQEMKNKISKWLADKPGEVINVRVGIGVSDKQVNDLKSALREAGALYVNYSTDFKEKDYPKDINNTISSNRNGASQELLKEYQDILNAYKKELRDGNESYSLNIEGSDLKRLEAIFFKMNKEQQENQVVIFVPASSMFLPKRIPSLEQTESFKDSRLYGVWINGKKVNNDVLNSYKNTDFASVIVSKLEKNATNYGKHYYQVDLMTNENYQSYYNEVIARKGYVLSPNGKKKANGQ